MIIFTIYINIKNDDSHRELRYLNERLGSYVLISLKDWNPKVSSLNIFTC